MHPIKYDVAVSVDGFISGRDGDISGFAFDGPVVQDYMARLESYAVAVMGRKTYEFGYRFGLKPGENPYKHMRTIVFSTRVSLPNDGAVQTQKTLDTRLLKELKASADGPIYLCGGGVLAGELLSKGLVDIVRLKRAPILLGNGVRLFGSNRSAARFEHVDTKDYGDGYLLQEFTVLQ